MMTSWVRVLLILVGTGLYGALAVLAGGGVSLFFAHPARGALFAVLVVLAVLALFAGGNLSPGVREDRANRWVLWVFGAIGLSSTVVPPMCDRFDILTFGGDGVRWLGVGLFAVGEALRLWPVVILGNRFSGLVAIQSGHRLVTDGIYGVIRNPSYLGLLIGMLGWALVFRSGAGVALSLAMVPPLLARIRAEERLLLAYFGQEYANYFARTRRLIPWIY